MQKRPRAVTILTWIVSADHEFRNAIGLLSKEILLYLSRYPGRPIFISFFNSTSSLIALKCISLNLSTLCKKGTARNLKLISIYLGCGDLYFGENR